LSEYRRRIVDEYRKCGYDITTHAPGHLTWLVQRHIHAMTVSELAAQANANESTITSATTPLAKRIGVRLPRPKRGRPPKKRK
jgi:hypothetical protein